MITIEKGFVLNRSNPLICPIKGNIPTNKYFRINAQQVTFTPAAVTTENIVSTHKDTFGNTLGTYETDIEPATIEIQFDWGPARAFAMALGASVDEFTQEAGAVVDEKITNINPEEFTVLEFGAIDVDTFTLSKGGADLEPGTDYILDASSGTIQAISDQLAEGELTASYDHMKIEGAEYHVGAETIFPVRMIFDSKNALDNTQDVEIVAWHVNLKPADSLSLLGSEPIAPTMTGELQLVAGKQSPITMRESKVIS